jgi:hypothetical protein
MAKKTVVSLSLDTEADRSILRWLDRQENKSAAIRAAIRAHIGGGGVTLGDVYQAIRDLDRKLQAGVILQDRGDSGGGETWDEPPDVAAALDRLAEL